MAQGESSPSVRSFLRLRGKRGNFDTFLFLVGTFLIDLHSVLVAGAQVEPVALQAGQDAKAYKSHTHSKQEARDGAHARVKCW